MMIFTITILSMIAVFAISHAMADFKPFKKDKKDYNQVYYFFKGNRYVRDYTGICFEGCRESIIVFRIQTGRTYDRMITICNVSLIFPTKKKYSW